MFEYICYTLPVELTFRDSKIHYFISLQWLLSLTSLIPSSSLKYSMNDWIIRSLLILFTLCDFVLNWNQAKIKFRNFSEAKFPSSYINYECLFGAEYKPAALEMVWEWKKISEKRMFSCFDKNQNPFKKEII